jgi:stringent starvation protein B
MDLICDLNLIPQIVVSPLMSDRDMDIPMDHVLNDCITINIGAQATAYVELDKSTGYLNVGARFNQVHHDLIIPIESIAHIGSKCGTINITSNPGTPLQYFDTDGAVENPEQVDLTQPSIQPPPTQQAPPSMSVVPTSNNSAPSTDTKRERPSWLKVVK